jgi:hypothetical protein
VIHWAACGRVARVSAHLVVGGASRRPNSLGRGQARRVRPGGPRMDASREGGPIESRADVVVRRCRPSRLGVAHRTGSSPLSLGRARYTQVAVLGLGWVRCGSRTLRDPCRGFPRGPVTDINCDRCILCESMTLLETQSDRVLGNHFRWSRRVTVHLRTGESREHASCRPGIQA